MWSKLGKSPAAEEIEITLLGPGYGESIVVHLGNNEWLIVDSCIDALDGNSSAAPLKYLRSIGVDCQTAVKYIVASHWDDDHVKGLAEVVDACPDALFITTQVFSDKKFTCYVEAISVGAFNTNGGNIQNIRKILHTLADRNSPIMDAGPARTLCSHPLIRSWSPSDLDKSEFLTYIAAMHPKAGEELRKAIPQTPNLASVVLTIEWDEFSVLLGADMERSSNVRRGWGAVVSEALRIGVNKADFLKVPHHGSENGHDDLMWDELLVDKPISILAPFGKGAIAGRPPKSTDVNRIARKSSKFFITARHAPTKKSSRSLAVERSLREGAISISSQKSPMGIIRHRRLSIGGWKDELFGAAYRVK